MSKLRENDVIRYRPEQHHCHEGLAVVRRRHDGVLRMVDTYWGWGTDSHDKVVAPETFEVLFNLDDFDEFSRHERYRWERFAPTDRQWMTAQAGCLVRYFVRKGAAEDHATIVQNAREALDDAESKLQSAKRMRDLCQRDLDELLTQSTTGATR